MEDDFDLRIYIKTLIKNWWLIVTMMILATLPVILFSVFLISPVYEATAYVLITQTRSQINFDPRFVTLDADNTASNYYASLNEGGRRAALATLVRNGTIAEQVAEQIKEDLAPEEQDPVVLMERVSGSLEGGGGASGSSGSLIRITATHPDAATATLIANTWAKAYVEYINELYSGQTESYVSVQQQAETAQGTYEQTQESLASFMAENQIGDLARQITDTLKLVDELQANKQAVFSEWAEAERTTIREHYDESRKLNQLLEDTKALQHQIQASEDPATATNELALMLLKAQVFASSKDLPSNIEFQVTLTKEEKDNTRQQLSDLEALIAVIEDRLQETEVAIVEQSATLLSSESWDALSGPSAAGSHGSVTDYTEITQSFDQALDELQAEAEQLNAQLAREQGQEQELTRARDLAWETYSTLQLKTAERGIAAEMTNTEVRLAAPAVEPIYPAGSGMIKSVFMAALVGMMLGVGLVMFMQYLYPDYDYSARLFGIFRRKDPTPTESPKD